MDKSRSLIPESFVAQLKELSNIVSVVSRYVPLKKAGRNFQGLCPFHQEKTPSFTVNEEKQIFHCFGCGLGGNVFGFLMHFHHLSFPEAIRELAGLQGLVVPEAPLSREAREADQKKQALIQIHRQAADFYRSRLKDSRAGKPGRAYLTSRGLDPETIEEFALGLAPEGWDGLAQELVKQKHSPELLAQSGLVVKKDAGGLYDRFRNRLMFPIFDERRQVVAFGGRTLGPDSPKYLNSPETLLFSKGRLLYGLAQALPTIRQRRQVLIVEGYFDLLTLYRHGFRQTVATLGTALGAAQVRRLKTLAEELILIYDGDAAGRQAALRSVSIFQQEGVAARIKILPPESDPDSFLIQVGAERFEAEIRQAVPMWTFFFDQHLSGAAGDIQTRIQRLERLLPTLQGLPSEAERAYYIQMTAERLGLSEGAVAQEVQKKRGGRDRSPRRRRDLVREPIRGLEWSLLEALVRIPGAWPRLGPYGLHQWITEPEANQIFQAVTRVWEETGSTDVSRIVESLEDQRLRNQVTALAVQEFASEKDQELFLQDLIRNLELREIRRQEQSLQQAVQEEAGKGLTPELKRLLEKKQDLMRQRKALTLSSKP